MSEGKKITLIQRPKSCCRYLCVVHVFLSRLHKIIKGPSGQALIKGGKDKFKFVKDILKRIDKLQSCGVQPVLVFDGGPLPRKR